MLAREIVEEAYKLRKLWEPSRHGILRQQADLRPEHQSSRSQRPAWRAFEPTAFLYAFTAFNSLYVIDWSASLDRDIYGVVELSGGEEKKIKKFVDFTLAGESGQRYFIDRLMDVTPRDGRSLTEVMEGLLVFRDRNGSPNNLREEIVEATKRLGPTLPAQTLIADSKALMKGVYEVRCNIFHGRKSVLDLSDGDPQMVRIGAFRQIMVALLDTFFSKVNQQRHWNPYFEGFLTDEIAPRAGDQTQRYE